MQWFNTNAPAIQAIASIVSVFVTVTLALITWWYVRVTRMIALTAEKQLQFLQADHAANREERKRQLLSMISKVRSVLFVCPTQSVDGEKIRTVTLWATTDPRELHSTAVTFDEQAAALAAEAALHLATLEEIAAQVQRTPVAQGVNWSTFDWERWYKALEGAERCLNSLKTHIERIH